VNKKVIPKIKVNVGGGYDPVELQQVIDTDLMTSSKTVVGAINELLDKIGTIDSSGSFTPSNGALLESITQELVDKWNIAQPNTIERIFVNNSEVLLTDKVANISIPTKASDIGAAKAEHDHDGVYLKADEPIPAALLPDYGGIVLGETAETAFRGDLGKFAYEHAISEHAPVNAQENVIEVFKIADVALPVEDKTVNIPVANAIRPGVVKSSSGANQVSIAADGAMRVGVVSTSTLKVPIGEELVLNGGTSDGSEIIYATRINNIGYDSIVDAVSSALYGDVVTLECDINLGTDDKDHLNVFGENVTLDTNGATFTANGSNGAIKVSGGSTTITGNGVVSATLGSDNYAMAVWANGGKVIIENGIYQNATDGSDRGTDLIYASGNAQIEIVGGTFIAAKPEWTLNCKDNDYKAGTASIVVKGGSFYKFDPANNNTEGPGTNYVAEGYRSILNGDYYVVKPVS
jgi:hypothetical protein